MQTACGMIPKTTIDICWLSGYSFEEIAEILGISVEEVRSQILPGSQGRPKRPA
jgi:hypothetical protein